MLHMSGWYFAAISYIYIDFNFEVQNDNGETLTIKDKQNVADGGSTGGFRPFDEQTVTSNGGNGEFMVTKK